jgi:hypothetical protein
MHNYLKYLFLSGVIILLLTGCSGGGSPALPGNDSPNLPASEIGKATTSETGMDKGTGGVKEANRYLWAYDLIYVDPSAPEGDRFEVVPVRSAGTHWNVISWLEKSPCTNCVKIISMTNSDHGTKLVKVSIKHPFTNPSLTGFDVRGIAMFNGSHMFPTSVLNISDRTMGDGELLNANGFTTLYNFSTKGFGPSGLQGYKKGKFASVEMPDSRLNGFKVFESAGASNTRNAFYAGDTITQTYDISMPDGQFIFGYAVDASYAPPSTTPVTDPMVDFPANANCYEPFKILVSIKSDTLTSQAGILTLTINVSDHQGPASYAKPVIECPELFDTPPSVADLGSGKFEVSIQNVKKAVAGSYPLLISVVDNQNAGSPSWVDLTGYQVTKINVRAETGWARTWGSTGYDTVNSVKVGPDGFIYAGGFFQGTVDFDPGTGSAQRTSDSDSIDAFVCKYDTLGTFKWVKTWGGPGTDTINDLAGFYLGQFIVVGDFENTVDFDPGPDVDAGVSNGGSDGYATIFKTDGTYMDNLTWGGAGDDTAKACVFDTDITMIGGSFEETVTLPYCDPITSNGKTDGYVFHIKSSKHLVAQYGGPGEDYVNGIAIKYPNIAVTGSFQGTVDFDTDGAGGLRTSNGSADVFLVGYQLIGGVATYSWAKVWGGLGWDAGNRVCSSAAAIYVTGSFCGSVGFNPDLPMDPDWHTSLGLGDAFISQWTTAGVYQGTTSWGGDVAMGIDSGFDICLDSIGKNVYCAGSFSGSALGLPSVGGFDCMVAKFNPDLTLQWATAWGGSGPDGCHGIAVDQWNRTFTGGSFSGTVDFNPGTGVDNHVSKGGYSDAFLVKLLADGGW